MGYYVPASQIQVARIYDCRSRSEDLRILIDRLWPRGMTREAANIDDWLRDVAPSHSLRLWFGHDPARWDEFQAKYRQELSQREELIHDLRSRARHSPISLVSAAGDIVHCHAQVLRRVLLGR